MAEAVAAHLRENGYDVLTAILSNLADHSLVTVTCQVAFADLATAALDGETVAQRISALSNLAQVDPYRAATHNKGIMNGIDAAVLASGNDWRAIESGAHDYAAKNGHYRGLAVWTVGAEGLMGMLELPMPVGTVGGSIKLTPQSIRISIKSVDSVRQGTGPSNYQPWSGAKPSGFAGVGDNRNSSRPHEIAIPVVGLERGSDPR